MTRPVAAKTGVNTNGDTQHHQASDAALGWIARLRSDQASAADRASFALWLGEHPRHRRAMDQMLELWDDLGALQLLRPESPVLLPRASANSRRWYAGAAAVAATVMLAILLYPLLGSDPVSTQYRTAVGERLSIALDDSSRVLLNTDSSISVTYTDAQRHIDLRRGEAWFEVKPDSARPFHVDAGETRVTAIGTAFNVYRQHDGADITVTEGVVRVSEIVESGLHKPATEVLHVNQQLRTGSGGWALSAAADVNAQLAWRQGELVADNMPLAVLVAELERYHDTNYMIADPAIAGLTLSGVLQLDQPDAILNALRLSLGIQTHTLDSGTVQLLKADQ